MPARKARDLGGRPTIERSGEVLGTYSYSHPARIRMIIDAWSDFYTPLEREKPMGASAALREIVTHAAAKLKRDKARDRQLSRPLRTRKGVLD